MSELRILRCCAEDCDAAFILPETDEDLWIRSKGARGFGWRIVDQYEWACPWH